MVVTVSPYAVRAFLHNQEVAREVFNFRSLPHAVRMAKYVAVTMARNAVHPRDFDADHVSWDVTPLSSNPALAATIHDAIDAPTIKA